MLDDRTGKLLLELATSAKSLWKGRSPEERRAYLDKVLSNPILNGVTIEFELKKPFAVLVQMTENVEWCPLVDDLGTALAADTVTATC